MNPTSANSEYTRKSLPWPFIIIVAVMVLPIVGAYVAYYTGMGVSEKTVNKGILLQPPAKLSALTDKGSAVPDLQERKWRLVLPVTSPCAQECQQNLYTTRQVHIRLGDKSVRVERIAANLGGDQGASFLQSIHDDHPRLQFFSVSRADWNNWLANSNAPEALEQNPYYLLVDQEGFAMMYYTANHHGNDLLDDIKRVLRYTPE